MEREDIYAADVIVVRDEVDGTGPWSPRGRFGRLSFMAWNFLLFIVVQLLLLAAAQGRLLMIGMVIAGSVGMIVVGIVGIIVELLVVATFAIFTMRRLHDLEASGWWSLLFIVPVVNMIFGLVLMFKAGTDGANRFGPPRVTRGWEWILGYIAIGVFMMLLVSLVNNFMTYGAIPYLFNGRYLIPY